MNTDASNTVPAGPRALREVPRVRTPIDEVSMAAILRDAHHHVFNDFPAPLCLAIAWAQCCFEHGHGRALDNHCYGNVTAEKTWPGDHFVIAFARKDNPHDAPVGSTAPTFTMRFRAFDDHIDGARSYWAYLKKQQQTALYFFRNGNPGDAVEALKRGSYFTGPLDVYKRSVVSLTAYFARHIASQL